MAVERILSASGTEIIRADGRLLASRFDPITEARHWVDARRLFLDKVKTVFVLGYGSGYHVDALCKSTSADIMVLEANDEIFGMRRPSTSRQVQVLLIESLSGIKQCDVIKKAVAGSFIVLSHEPSVSLHPDIYGNIRTLLIGRDWGQLNWQWSLHGSPDFDQAKRIDKSASPLTIMDLQQTELVTNSFERERMLFKALRELLK